MSVFEEFLKYEDSYNTYDKEVLGIQYWEFVRYAIFAEIKVRVNNMAHIVNVTRPKQLKKYVISVRNLKKYLGFAKIKSADILFVSHPRRILQNGKFENIYTDELEMYLSKDYSCVTVEEPCWETFVPADSGHMFPVKTSNILYIDFYELSFLFKSRIFQVTHKKEYKQIEKEVLETFQELEKIFNLNIDNLKKHIIEKIIYIYLMKDKYSKLIDSINPKIVIFNYWPTIFKTLLINICKEKKIPTVELQHGTITYDDPVEHKCHNIEKCYNICEYLLTFGEKHIDLNYLTTKKENIIEVGYPFLEKKAKQYYDLPEELESNNKYILIMSQTALGEQLSKFASELADLLRDMKEYKIIFKFHPNEINKNYSCLNKENIVQIKYKGSEIYKYQRFAEAQVGVYSTSIYEGLMFDLPTFILKNCVGAEETEKNLSYMKQGVYFINNAFEVYNELKKGVLRPQEKDIDRLWKKNSLKNIDSFIKQILK